MQRHYLLDITDEGRCWAMAHLAEADLLGWDQVQAEQLIVGGHGSVKAPGIIRREERPNLAGIPVGFASYYLVGGRRIRVAAAVPAEKVIKVTSPYQVLETDIASRTPCLKALAEIKMLAAALDIKLGVWGSAGLEVYTGLPYTHAESDLDLLIAAAPLVRINSLLEQATMVGRRYGCRVDIEVDLPSGYGVNAQELFQNAEQVLGKGLNHVGLLPRTSILAMLEGTNIK